MTIGVCCGMVGSGGILSWRWLFRDPREYHSFDVIYVNAVSRRLTAVSCVPSAVACLGVYCDPSNDRLMTTGVCCGIALGLSGLVLRELFSCGGYCQIPEVPFLGYRVSVLLIARGTSSKTNEEEGIEREREGSLA